MALGRLLKLVFAQLFIQLFFSGPLVKRKQSDRESPKQLLGSYLSWCTYPGQVTKMGIHRNCHHVTVHIMKFICFVAESHNFRGADKGAGWEDRAGCNDSAIFSENLSEKTPLFLGTNATGCFPQPEDFGPVSCSLSVSVSLKATVTATWPPRQGSALHSRHSVCKEEETVSARRSLDSGLETSREDCRLSLPHVPTYTRVPLAVPVFRAGSTHLSSFCFGAV